MTATDGRLVDAVLGYLATAKGREAVSYIHRGLNRDGWRGLGCLADFESRLRALGFTVQEGRNERGQKRREVSVEGRKLRTRECVEAARRFLELADLSEAQRLRAYRNGCDRVVADCTMGAEADAAFDGGEWSGPAHDCMMTGRLDALARRLGFQSSYEADCMLQQQAMERVPVEVMR